MEGSRVLAKNVGPGFEFLTFINCGIGEVI